MGSDEAIPMSWKDIHMDAMQNFTTASFYPSLNWEDYEMQVQKEMFD